MKTIGLIGGMSWESSAEYYRIINEEVKNQLGGLHSANCLLFSVDFHEIERYQSDGNWGKAGEVLGNAACSLAKGGADFIIICTNTMHKVVDDIQKRIRIPILHIADATAKQIENKEMRTVGLLGTKYTMEQDFFLSRIQSKGIKVIIPDSGEREIINRVIFDELCVGKINSTSKQDYLKVIEGLIEKGAEGIILGCTEIGLLIKQEGVKVPLFDTTKIHAIEAVQYALEEDG